jgi:hypothetical protein
MTRKRQPGRPRHKPKARAALSLLGSPNTRRRIENAADRSGRSMALEVELRVERSFHEDWIVERLAQLIVQGGRP